MPNPFNIALDLFSKNSELTDPLPKTLTEALVRHMIEDYCHSERQLSLLIKNPDLPLADPARLAQAKNLRMLSRPQEALDLLKPLMVRHPKLLTLHIEVGLALIAAGSLDDAKKHLKKALIIFADLPERILVILDLCTVLTMLGQALEGLDLCDQSLQHQELDTRELHSNRAGFLIMLNRLEEAEEELFSTVNTYPYYAMAHANLGLIGLLTQRSQLAETHLLHAVELDPNLASLCEHWQAHFNANKAGEEENNDE